ncbi:hypothetical protein GKZ68_01220 [Hymenobacter sp. BRD128]|uniref:hypothetical protein n=1 Tax=Hymenobacter sp. BRD128 TaxID=2675878 RepID=UPI00156544A5|nr:hypothetical protein [Hymenobacter sp. BRD128]QKG55375.1 hypothetical protein GKZ68_01220 [Hymenobacter sp. BRD128]
MKNILFIALFASATAAKAAPAPTIAAPATVKQTVPAAGQAPSAKEMKKIRKQRKQNGPEVYKGTVAEQRRIVTDAPGAEKDKDNDGDETSKKERKSKKN